MKTKTELMAVVAAGGCREAFTFVPDDGTPERNYDITQLRHLIRSERVRAEVQLVALSAMVPYLSEHRVWEQARVDALTPDSYELDPPIALMEPDGTVILADGVHRVMRAHQLGRTEIAVAFVQEAHAPRVAPNWGQLPEHDWGTPLAALRPR